VQTITVLAKRLNINRWQVEYLLQRQQIKPMARAGLVRLYPDGVQDQLTDALVERSGRKEGGVVDVI